jgi:diacylglycerol kinase (ATP)
LRYNILNKEISDFLGLLRRRTLGATKYSWQGLRVCYKYEEAFRIEVYAALFLAPLAYFIATTKLELVILIVTLFIVLIVELLNSAIENIVDRVSEEHHHLSGRSKDQGSAAVMLSVIVCIVTWLFIGLK